MKCRRRGLQVTSEAILKGFAHLAVIYTICRDSSVVVRLTPLTRFQQQVVATLAKVTWPPCLAPSDLQPEGEPVVARPRLEQPQLPVWA